ARAGADHRAPAAALVRDDALHARRRRLARTCQCHADRVEERARSNRSRGGWRLGADRENREALHRAVAVADSGLPIAAMNRCLMNTQSSGGFAVGADSAIFATITCGRRAACAAARLRRKSASSCAVVASTRIARAAAARSAP